METVTTALVTGITSMATESMTAIGSVLPVVLPVLGAIAVIRIGIRVFNFVTKK